MRHRHIPILLALLTLTASRAYADGLIYKLPKDGTWATYVLESSSSVKGEVLERVGWRRIAGHS